MSLVFPFWFKQRQCKAELQANTNMLEVSGPNLPKAYLTVSPADPIGWRAGLRAAADGPDVATALPAGARRGAAPSSDILGVRGGGAPSSTSKAEVFACR